MDPFVPSLEIPAEPQRVVTVMAVSPDEEDRRSLRDIFRHSNWKLFFTGSRRDALEALRRRSVGVVLCEAALPDGSWKDLYRELGAMPAAPPLIVTSWQADDWLWAEVLSIGGYDVLAKPFEFQEVVRVTSLAWLHWKESQAPAKAPAKTLAKAARAAS